MDLKSIVAIASGDADDEATLAAAARLSADLSAHLTIISAFPDPSADLIAYGSALHNMPAEVLIRLSETEQGQQKEIDDRAARLAGQAGLQASDVSIRKRELQPVAALASEATLADLVIMGGGVAKAALSGLFADALISVRAPVLLVKGAPLSFGSAAIAWDGSAQAGRALRAAAPMLKKFKQVFLLTNDEDEGAADGNAYTAQRYLARLGVDAAPRSVRGADAAASLLAAAKAEGCELLVAGGYGRPRLYELVLGGATRTFVRAEGPPHILLAH